MEHERGKMAPMNGRLKAALAGVVLTTSMVSAQQAVRPGTVVEAAKPGNSVSKLAAGDTRSLINGVAVNADQVPLGDASIRLRNLRVNAIEQVDTTNELGEFTFVAQPGIPYVVEIVDPAGRVLAVGDVILIDAGEVSGTIVVLPSSRRTLAGGFSGMAIAVIAAAAGTGLTIIDPALPKVSPTR